MSYKYEDEKKELFTDDGQRLFLGIRDHVHKLLGQAGAVRMAEAINPPGRCCSNSWTLLACVDRLVELGEIREITDTETAGQYRVFVKLGS